jgi:ubiquinone/menaquinone biosynthesis C-methylase UbiE
VTVFKDHFSGHAEEYARYRPGYPPSLFGRLASLVEPRRLAWDCGTGSGQVAGALAPHFKRVIATDASASQIANAMLHPGVEYRVAPAEASGLAPASVDLVTVAQALHWFDLEAFWAEVRRVVRAGGVVAAWCYDELSVDRWVDPALRRLYHEIVSAHWPPERALVETGYATLSFPFEELAPIAVSMEARWDLARLAGYLHTWSAVRRYQTREGRDPVEMIMPDLSAAWGDPATTRKVQWPVRMRLGRVSASRL